MLEPVTLGTLSKHLEDLRDLWRQRRRLERSPEHVASDILDLDDRIEAHLDALRIAGEDLAPLMEAGLASEDPAGAFVAAYVLLDLGREDVARRVVGVFREAEGGRLAGLRDAFSHGVITPVLQELREAFVSPPSRVAIAAGEVLAVHQQLDSHTGRLTELLTDEDAEVRRAAWHIIAILDSSGAPA
jgi:hypothetical protein